MRKVEALAQNANGILARVLIPVLMLILAGVMLLNLAERPKPAGRADAPAAALHPPQSTPLPYFRRCQNTGHAPCR
jgi:hypothetical protein